MVKFAFLGEDLQVVQVVAGTASSAHEELVPMQAGDVPVTFADTTPLEEDFGFRPSTPLRDGLRAFAQWYAKYYGTCE